MDQTPLTKNPLSQPTPTQLKTKAFSRLRTDRLSANDLRPRQIGIQFIGVGSGLRTHDSRLTTKMHKTILHLDLDTFFVSVERLRDSRLANVPLIIGGTGDRGVVASCSYETRQFGVSSAMPIRLARRLCPHAVVISGDHELYSRYSGIVTEVIADRAPLFEKSSIDEFYIDLSGMERFFGSWKWASELRQIIGKETGLPSSFGLSINKMVAKVATGEAKPNGQIEISRGTEQQFLGPLPVTKIPMIGRKTSTMLINMGVRQVFTLREIPRELLERIFGKMGVLMWKRARGIDDTPVIPYSERKSISSERTYSQDTIDVKEMHANLKRMTEKLAYQLRREGRMTACVTVKIRYSNFDTLTKQAHIPYTASDHVLTKKVIELFEKLYDRRLLIRLLGVRFTDLITGGHQINLFEDTEEMIRLYQAIDKVKHRFGESAVMRAAGMKGR